MNWIITFTTFLKPIYQFLCILVLFILLFTHSCSFLPQIQLNRTALCKYWGKRSFHKFPFHSYNIVFAGLFSVWFVITCCLCVSACCLYLLFLLSLCCCVSTHRKKIAALNWTIALSLCTEPFASQQIVSASNCWL